MTKEQLSQLIEDYAMAKVANRESLILFAVGRLNAAVDEVFKPKEIPTPEPETPSCPSPS